MQIHSRQHILGEGNFHTKSKTTSCLKMNRAWNTVPTFNCNSETFNGQYKFYFSTKKLNTWSTVEDISQNNEQKAQLSKLHGTVGFTSRINIHDIDVYIVKGYILLTSPNNASIESAQNKCSTVGWWLSFEKWHFKKANKIKFGRNIQRKEVHSK